MAKKEVKSNKNWIIIIVILIIGFISLVFAGMLSLFSGSSSISSISIGNVAVIPVKGVIVTEGGGFGFTEYAVSGEIIDLIEKADNNPSVKAIVFEINSPGGSAVASEEIGHAIKKVNKTTVAYIREVGASGGYWVASATDRIFANRMSITGSIGVIGSYLEFSGFLERYNITYQRLVSGKYKDAGSPYKKLSPVEEQLIQEQLDLIRDYFVDEVAENREIGRDQVDELATGMFYIGSKAKDYGLIDEIGGKDEVKAYLEKELNMTVKFVNMQKEKSFLELLAQAMSQQSFWVGKGIGDTLLEPPRQVQQVNVWA
ncbi:MAG: signal peptide peptidase SppA [Candidatus Woesearchaeota archaeon]